MNARLAYDNSFLEVTNFSHWKSEVLRGNPYNIEFDLRIQSGVFYGEASCEYDINDFTIFIDNLRRLYNFEIDTVYLDDMCYGSKVMFVMDCAGHIDISGKIFGRAMIHSMEFAFYADQTVLKSFIEELEMLMRLVQE